MSVGPGLPPILDEPEIRDDASLETDPDIEAEEEALAGSESPRTVLITGAAGNIGRKLRAAWADRYEIIPIDRRFDPDDPDLILADLAEWDEGWAALFDEADAVVHLAANPDEHSPWEALHGPNMDATANVLLAAVQGGVDRFVFASSNHAMGGYHDDGSTAPIAADLPPRPGNPYGATKLMGERLGRSFAAATGLTFVALRIGWVQRGENRPETLPDDWARAIWLSDADLVRLFTRAVEADLDEGAFVVANGLSRNPDSRWTLDEARAQLGYEPEDGS